MHSAPPRRPSSRRVATRLRRSENGDTINCTVSSCFREERHCYPGSGESRPGRTGRDSGAMTIPSKRASETPGAVGSMTLLLVAPRLHGDDMVTTKGMNEYRPISYSATAQTQVFFPLMRWSRAQVWELTYRRGNRRVGRGAREARPPPSQGARAAEGTWFLEMPFVSVTSHCSRLGRRPPR